MTRTQLYLEEDLSETLRLVSRDTGLTMSELVRRAVRERYLGDRAKRKQAMQAVVGIRQAHPDLPDTKSYIRQLRRGSRLDRLTG